MLFNLFKPLNLFTPLFSIFDNDYHEPAYTPAPAPVVEPEAPQYDTAATQWLSGTGSKDVFVINGNSWDYQASRTMDNTGIVVWSGDKFDILTGFETLRFNDTEIKADASGNFSFPAAVSEPAPATPEPTPVPVTPEPTLPSTPSIEETRYVEVAGTQYVEGTTAKDVFVVTGNSADYNVVTALDGVGVVVKRGDQFDVLHGIDTIRFNDKDVQADSKGQFDIHGVLNAQGEMLHVNVAGTQWMEGFSAKDVYIAGGKSTDFGVGKAADGWGVVVWQGDNYDILYDVEVIRFDDKDVLSSSIM